MGRSTRPSTPTTVISSLSYIPLATGEQRFLDTWSSTCREGHKRERSYIEALRARGIKAAHPDDGWVKRDTNELHFCYPHFNDGAEAGDLVALGYEFDKTTRIVRLLSYTTTGRSGMKWWKFEEVEKMENNVLLPAS